MTNYGLSHKVEISERSKNAKNVQLSINVVIWMSTLCPLSFHSSIFSTCFKFELWQLNSNLWLLKRSLISTLWDTLSLSHLYIWQKTKVSPDKRLKNYRHANEQRSADIYMLDRLKCSLSLQLYGTNNIESCIAIECFKVHIESIGKTGKTSNANFRTFACVSTLHTESLFKALYIVSPIKLQRYRTSQRSKFKFKQADITTLMFICLPGVFRTFACVATVWDLL